MKYEKILAERPDKVIYKDGENALKVFNSNYSKADILNEALNQARVEETGLNIPALNQVTMIDGQWVISTKFIEGKTLAQLMDENPEKLDEYLNLFVDLQLEMNKETVPLLNKLKDKMNRKISESGYDATTRYELHTRLESMPKHTKLCHGDFNPSNIIVTDNGTPYILDWSHATQGNASADVARTYLLFCLDGKEELADKYLDLFKLLEQTRDVTEGVNILSEKLGEYLDEEVVTNMTEIATAVNATKGAKFELVFDPTLVRGMSYYTGTIFEISMPELGAACGGGGRYDKMIGKFTGNDVPACGFSIGFERIILLLMESGFKIPESPKKVAYLVEKKYPADKLVDVMNQAKDARANGQQVLVVRMNKNKKFQKEQLMKEGYEEFVEFFNR